MDISSKIRIRNTALVVLGLISGSAHAQDLTIQFENLNPVGGMTFTPAFFGLSDGSFDLFDPGVAVSSELESLAEVGATTPLTTAFTMAPGTGAAATTPGGPITGGSSRTVDLNVADPSTTRFLTFASMVVPSNDLFIGNADAMGIELFDAAGNFNGPITIEIFGSNVWDAGSEVNNADDGAAFLQGIDGSMGTDEGGVAGLFFDRPDAGAYLNSLLGRTTAPGFELTSVFTAQDPIARITIVSAPSTLAFAPLAGLTIIRRRRKN